MPATARRPPESDIPEAKARSPNEDVDQAFARTMVTQPEATSEADLGSRMSGEERDPGASKGATEARPGDSAPSIIGTPSDAGPGFRKPRLEDPGCVQRAIRFSDEWIGQLGVAPLLVRFAIDADGTPHQFQSMTEKLDGRLAVVVWRAIQSCRWLPGYDANGRAIALWVILPIRVTRS
jgi:periplasmic protein TonB